MHLQLTSLSKTLKSNKKNAIYIDEFYYPCLSALTFRVDSVTHNNEMEL